MLNDHEAGLLILQAFLENLRTVEEGKVTVDDLVRVTGLDPETVNRVGAQLRSAKYLRGRLGGVYGSLSAPGIDYYTREMQGRYPLTITAKRILRYAIDKVPRPGLDVAANWVRNDLHIDEDSYQAACRLLEQRKLITSSQYAYRLIAPTDAGTQAVLDDFRRPGGSVQYVNSSSVTITNSTINGQVVGINNGSMSVVFEQLDQMIEERGGQDVEALQLLAAELKYLVAEKRPIELGMLRKFGDIMERNSWVTGAVAQALLGIAMGGN